MKNMKSETLTDVRLRDYDLDNLKLLEKLRAGLFRTKAEICIEHAKYITQYLKEAPSDEDSIEIRYASAVNHSLSFKTPLFFDDNLLAGTTTSKACGAPIYPQYSGLSLWPELDTISTREKNPLKISAEEIDTLNHEIFPYWMKRNILEYTRKKHGNPPCMKLFERIIFFIAGKAGCLSHTVPNYREALEKGIGHLLEQAADREAALRRKRHCSDEMRRNIDFYRSVQIALQGIIAYARNLSLKAAAAAATERNPWRKENLIRMSQVCKRIPEKPATSFREAINSLWIIQIAIHAENVNMAVSPGRLDQILYPYYKNDIEKGKLTIGQALELIGCLWLKFNDNVNPVPEASQELFGGSGTVPAVTLGGISAAGKDAVNDLTYLMLRVSELLKTRDPNVNARYHFEINPPSYRDRIAEVIVETRAIPAVHNDVVNIKALERQGIARNHARDYAVIGCVELASAGRSYDASSSIIMNLVAPLELALYDGKRPATGMEQIGPKTGDPSQFNSFDEFWQAYKSQFAWLASQAIDLNERLGMTHQEILPSPLLSSFFEGPLNKGQDLIFGGALYNSSGATHFGFADTVDSLNAIEHTVFNEKKCTFHDLISALEADFKGYEELHAYLSCKAPKYGTENIIALKNSRNLIRFLYDFYQAHTSYRGGKYRPAYWTMTNHAGQGKFCGALPNGRKAEQALASGITPVSQAAKDLSACFKSVAGLDATCMPGGSALNLKYPPLSDKAEVKKLGQALEAFFCLGGQHVQYNIFSYETLIDARNNPHKYPELLVRVSGYSAYFHDLSDAMQEEIITRSQYCLETGQAMPFPQKNSACPASTRPDCENLTPV